MKLALIIAGGVILGLFGAAAIFWLLTATISRVAPRYVGRAYLSRELARLGCIPDRRELRAAAEMAWEFSAFTGEPRLASQTRMLDLYVAALSGARGEAFDVTRDTIRKYAAQEKFSRP